MRSVLFCWCCGCCFRFRKPIEVVNLWLITLIYGLFIPHNHRLPPLDELNLSLYIHFWFFLCLCFLILFIRFDIACTLHTFTPSKVCCTLRYYRHRELFGHKRLVVSIRHFFVCFFLFMFGFLSFSLRLSLFCV